MPAVLIRGGEVLRTEPFVADGEEIQLNDSASVSQYSITVILKTSLLQVVRPAN